MQILTPSTDAAICLARRRSGPAIPRPATTRSPSRTGTPPGTRQHAVREHGGQRRIDLRARTLEGGGAGGHRLGDERRRGGRAVHRVLLDRVAADVDHRDGDPQAPRCAASAIARSASPSAHSCSGWLAGGGSPYPRPGSSGSSPNASSQRFSSSPCCPRYGSPSVHSTIRSSELAGLPSAISMRRSIPGMSTNGPIVAPDALKPPTTRRPDRLVVDRHAAGAGEVRLGRARHEPGGDRRRQRRHPQVVLGARDLLGGRDPRLRPRPGHPAGAAAVHARRRHEHAAAPDDRERAAHADVRGLVDRARDQAPGLAERDVGRVRHRRCAANSTQSSKLYAVSCGPMSAEHWGRRPRDWAELAEPSNAAAVRARCSSVSAPAPGTRAARHRLRVGLRRCAWPRRAGATVTGIDITPGAARDRRASACPNADFVVGGHGRAAVRRRDASTPPSASTRSSSPTTPPARSAKRHAWSRRGGLVAATTFAEPERNESTALHLALEPLRARRPAHARASPLRAVGAGRPRAPARRCRARAGDSRRGARWPGRTTSVGRRGPRRARLRRRRDGHRGRRRAGAPARRSTAGGGPVHPPRRERARCETCSATRSPGAATEA